MWTQGSLNILSLKYYNTGEAYIEWRVVILFEKGAGS